MGTIVTFYSFKGGTGRSMALANCACLLADQSPAERVLMIDWDIEAPGLHRYFQDTASRSFPSVRAYDEHPGIVDFFSDLLARVSGGRAASAAETRATLRACNLDRYIIPTNVEGLFLWKAGGFGPGYGNRLSAIDWRALHEWSPWLYSEFAALLAEHFNWVFVDSRTGLTDSGAICTSILPDILVLVFTPNRQSLLGVLDIARSSADYRKESDDLRPLRMFPLPSRIEAAEPVLRDAWRLGDTQSGIPGYQPAFQELFTSVYGLPDCDLTEYFNEIQVQHVPRFAYGEDIAVRFESNDRLSLTRSFTCVLDRLRSASSPWEAVRAAPHSTPKRNEWADAVRARVLSRMSALPSGSFTEMLLIPAMPLEGVGARNLLQAATAAQVPVGGWPIGAVVSAPHSRPKPVDSGIEAEIFDERLQSYDLWGIRDDGPFYLFRSLEEEPEYVLLETRLDRAIELLLYCRRLYTTLGLPPEAAVDISVAWRGLAGRILASNPPDLEGGWGWVRVAGSAMQNDVEVDLRVTLADLRNGLAACVRDLTARLFAVFNFFELPETGNRGYNEYVQKRLRDWL